MCAQALWVDVSGGFGRSPPSSYPSGEQCAARPNLCFTAFDKPSNGISQRAREEIQRDPVCGCVCGRVVGLCSWVLLSPSGLKKKGFSQFRFFLLC